MVTPVECFVRGKEFAETLTKLESLSEVPFDVLVDRARPLADVLKKRPEDIVEDWLLGYLDNLVPPPECAPELRKEIIKLIEPLEDAVRRHDLAVIKHRIQVIRDIQKKVR